MKLTSPAFSHEQFIPSKYSYHGGNNTPPLKFEEIPQSAKSLALVCHDPDSPTEGGYTHWVVWNIPVDTTELEESTDFDGAVYGVTDWGTNAWGGPAPHAGTHHYDFYLFALDKMLDLPPTANQEQLEQAMTGHILEEALLTGLYSAN
jgi:Raf kinase inhibitor-like YbhB/YbcL family protein